MSRIRRFNDNNVRLWSAVVLTAVVLVAGCGQPDGSAASDADADAAVSSPSSTIAEDSNAPAVTVDAGSDIADIFEQRTQSLPAADGIPEPVAPDLLPVAIQVPALGLDGVSIEPVGVEANGDMEVPAPLDVGWYQYGPRPGSSGSAVLAGHIASGGTDGAFRYLHRLQPGDTVTVEMVDPARSSSATTTATFEVVGVEQYDKQDLPFDQIFTSGGPSQVVLITCGGRFDSDSRSYTDNIVVYTKPI